MKEIPLSQGKVALVDDEDYEWLMQWKWHAKICGKTWYAERSIRKGLITTKTYMHRLILSTPKGFETDHRNHDGLDNRRDNLRVCTASENRHNQLLQPKKKSSYFKGIIWNKRLLKWESRIHVNCKNIYLGSFASEIDATLAYDEAAKKYFGEFAYTNFIEV